MQIQKLFLFYGIFLIVCGLVAFTLIGKAAKTAILSGSLTGIFALSISYLFFNEIEHSKTIGIIYTALLMLVFAWRLSIAFFTIVTQTISNDKLTQVEFKGKVVAFLIISAMFIASLVLLILQVAVM